PDLICATRALHVAVHHPACAAPACLARRPVRPQPRRAAPRALPSDTPPAARRYPSHTRSMTKPSASGDRYSSNAVLDLVVVGGGVIGSSIAYHLARAGARVRVYEQAAPAVAPSASWASAGGVRQQGRDPREWPLTLEASRRWPNLAAELEAPTGF